MKRRLAIALGVPFAVVGILSLVAPELTAGLPFGEIPVLILGLVFAIGGVRTLKRRRSTPRQFTEVPDHETEIELPTPGDDIDAEIADIVRTPTTIPGAAGRGGTSRRLAFRKQVRSLAIETIQRRQGISEARAKAMLDDGTWTDDPFAASFMLGRVVYASAFQRVRESLRSESAYTHRARRAMDAIYDFIEEDDHE